MIKPTMYSGLSWRNSTAKPNMRIGPMIQFCTRDNASTRRSRNTSPISSYRTFARGGYIMRMSPTAIGTEVVPTLARSSIGTNPGTKYPSPTPTAIATKIQSVRNRSRNESLFAGGRSACECVSAAGTSSRCFGAGLWTLAIVPALPPLQPTDLD